MKKYIPFGAHKIIQARQSGKKPSELIIVSLCGKLENELNPVVVLQEGLTHEWQWARGLELCFWAEPKFYEPKQIVDAWEVGPKRVILWNWVSEQGFDIFVAPHEDTIHMPQSQWRQKVLPMPWRNSESRLFAQGDLQWT